MVRKKNLASKKNTLNLNYTIYDLEVFKNFISKFLNPHRNF